MRKNLQSALVLGGLILAANSVSGQSLTTKLKASSLKGKSIELAAKQKELEAIKLKSLDAAKKKASEAASKESSSAAEKQKEQEAEKLKAIEAEKKKASEAASKESSEAAAKQKASASNARIAEDIALPQPKLETNYYYDYGSASWEISTYTTNKYDAKGNLILSADFFELEGDTVNKTTYSYDAKGNETGYGYYGPENGVLILVNGNRIEYAYDGYGRITSEVNSSYDNDTWSPGDKTVYGYTGVNDEPSSITQYTWNGTSWEEGKTYTDVTWYDYDNFEVKSYTSVYFDEEEGLFFRESFTSTSAGNGIELYEVNIEDEWIAYNKYTTSTEPGGSVSIGERLDFDSYEWIYTSKNINLVDEMGNDAGYIEYEWNGTAWEVYNANISVNEYNENGVLVQSISYDENERPTSKTIFSDFETATVTATVAATTGLELKAFPNPVNDALNISIPNQESAQVNLYNMQNSLVYSANIQAGNTSVDVSDLSEGVYMLQIQTASGIQKTERIVKK